MSEEIKSNHLRALAEEIKPRTLRALACDIEDCHEPQSWADYCRAAATMLEIKDARIAELEAALATLQRDASQEIARLRASVAELEAALRFYADPFKYTDIHGDDVRVPHFYSETDFGETARVALGLDKPWSLQP